MHGNHVRTLRWLIAGFGLAAGLVLLAYGQGLLGGIMVVMAGLRIVMLVSVNRRTGSFGVGATMAPASNGRISAGGRVGGGRDEMLQRLARNELDVAATAIGISPAELRGAIDDGRTISAMAADAGVSSRQVVDAVVRDATARVDRGVAAGTVPAGRARTLQSRLPQWAERFVLSTPAMLTSTSPVPDPSPRAIGNG
jgi:hypothetical protein